MGNIKNEIVKEIGVLNENGDWKTEINLVRWNDAPAKIDIRSWSADHKKCGKGITITNEEGQALVGLLSRHLKL